jgi:hypothetical protein
VNAPATIEPVPDDLLAVYGMAVAAIMPQCFGEELELRCRMLRARESATAALQHCAAETVPILNEIVRLSVLYAYASVETERLRALVQCLRRLMSASAFADAAFAESGDARE